VRAPEAGLRQRGERGGGSKVVEEKEEEEEVNHVCSSHHPQAHDDFVSASSDSNISTSWIPLHGIHYFT